MGAYMHALIADRSTGCFEGIHPGLCSRVTSYMSKKGHGPYTPIYHQAMAGKYKEQFQEAMNMEIEEWIEKNTWLLRKRGTLHPGTNVLPSTWSFKINQYPDGKVRKFKA